VLTHAVLPAVLARLQPGAGADADRLAFVSRLAAAYPEAAGLAAFFTRHAGWAS
jgi:hypothetical protein